MLSILPSPPPSPNASGAFERPGAEDGELTGEPVSSGFAMVLRDLPAQGKTSSSKNTMQIDLLPRQSITAETGKILPATGKDPAGTGKDEAASADVGQEIKPVADAGLDHAAASAAAVAGLFTIALPTATTRANASQSIAEVPTPSPSVSHGHTANAAETSGIIPSLPGPMNPAISGGSISRPRNGDQGLAFANMALLGETPGVAVSIAAGGSDRVGTNAPTVTTWSRIAAVAAQSDHAIASKPTASPQFDADPAQPAGLAAEPNLDREGAHEQTKRDVAPSIDRQGGGDRTAAATPLSATTSGSPIASSDRSAAPPSSAGPVSAFRPGAADAVASVVDRLLEARASGFDRTASVSVRHAEFGDLKITFAQPGQMLEVAVSAVDSESQSALASAMQQAERPIAKDGSQANAGSQGSTGSLRSPDTGASGREGHGQSASRDTDQRRSHEREAPASRSGSLGGQRQDSDPSRTLRGGIYA